MNPANAWLLLTTRSPGVNFIPGGWGTVHPSDVAGALGGLERSRFLLGMAALAGDRYCLEELVNFVWSEVIHPAAIAGEWKIRPGSEAYRRLAALAVFELLNGDRCYVCNGVGRYEPPASTAGVDPWRASFAKAELPAAPNKASLRILIRRHRRLLDLSKVVAREFEPHETSPKDRERLRQLLVWVADLAKRTQITQDPGNCELCAGAGQIRWEGRHRAWLSGFSADHWYRTWASRYSPIQVELTSWVSDCLSHVARRFGRETSARAA